MKVYVAVEDNETSRFLSASISLKQVIRETGISTNTEWPRKLKELAIKDIRKKVVDTGTATSFEILADYGLEHHKQVKIMTIEVTKEPTNETN